MISRQVTFPTDYSFFLFGPRGSGKTTLLRERFGNTPHLYINLLNPGDVERYRLHPDILSEEIAATEVRWIVIDEIQKLPVLLDLVHHHIEISGKLFALSGSSARKLRHGGANLLAGRAFTRYLHPFTATELGKRFDLPEILQWGALPKIFEFTHPGDKSEFLQAYTYTYLNEEILQEQIVRKMDPFKRFLVVSAQMSGKILNYAKIAREIGTSAPTVQTYFQILEDTLIGLILTPWHVSIRKRQSGNPKFYYFDTGVLRTLLGHLALPVLRGTYDFGNLFEHFVINEILRNLQYTGTPFDLSYLRTSGGLEIDLIIERPNMPVTLIEIKSATALSREDVRPLQQIMNDLPDSLAFCLSMDRKHRKIGDVYCLPWHDGIGKIVNG